MLRQCIEVVGLRRGGEIVFLQFEWYRGFVLLVSGAIVSWGVFIFIIASGGYHIKGLIGL